MAETERVTFVDLLHVTWRGRVSVAYYALRRLFVAPAPAADRCCMGSPIGEFVHCPRRARRGPEELWCDHHAREMAKW